MKRTYNITVIREACRRYGMTDTAHFEKILVNTSWDMEEDNINSHATNVRPCRYDGKTYDSVAALGRSMGVAPQVLFYYIRSGRAWGGSMVELIDETPQC